MMVVEAMGMGEITQQNYVENQGWSLTVEQ